MSFEPQTLLRPNTAKSAELQVMIWFLEAGLEVFAPVADLNATDLVFRHPTDGKLVTVQVRHKQPTAKHEGRLANPWAGTEPPFDYLVFYQPAKNRGLIVPKFKLKKKGRMFLFYKGDPDGYSTGSVRPLYADYGFDFSALPHELHSRAFVERFLQIYGSVLNDGSPDCRVDGALWSDDAGDIQRWLEWSDSLEPVLAGDELKRFEADLRRMREEQSHLLGKWQKRTEILFK